MLVLCSYRPWLWEALYRWQCKHRGFAPEDVAANVPRPVEPDRALFVGAVADGRSDPVAGVGLHETRSYIFLDDLTTNPAAPGRMRYAAVEHLLKAAAQYAVSVGKPLCAFTSVPSLYRIAKRLGFTSRPAGALLVYAAPALVLGEAVKKTGRPVSRAARFTLDGENVRRVRHPAQPKVPSQVGKKPNGQKERAFTPIRPR